MELKVPFAPIQTNTRFSFTTLFLFGLACTIDYILLTNQIYLLGFAGLIFTLTTGGAAIGDIKNFRTERKKNQKNFTEQLKDFEIKIANQKELKKKLESIENRNAFVKERIKQLSSSAKKCIPITFKVLKGKSELFFLSHLQSIFRENIFLDQALIEKDWLYSYCPDFVFFNGKVSIDIEIDETYSLTSLEPIHYYDSKKNIQVDEKRDRYFLSHQWFVVRFSEKQVYESPLSCCRIIANIIKFAAFDDQYIKILDGIPKLQKHEVWTYSDSIDEILNKSRNQNVGRDL